MSVDAAAFQLSCMIPQFQPKSLVVQIADFLREQIVSGVWSSWIPTERELADQLRVSRGTVRAALAVLAKERLITSRQGVGTISSPQKDSRQLNDPGRLVVTLLMPEPLNALRPYLAIWIDTLKSQLHDSGYSMRLLVNARVFQRNGDRQLKRLVAQHPSSCWILALSNESIQRWFEASKTPCVVVGDIGKDISLPFIALDLPAVCRHAAGEFLRLGHRRMLLISHAQPSPGAVDATEKFLDVAKSHGPDVHVEVLLYDDDVDQLCRRVKPMIKSATPFTCIMMLNPLLYFSVQSTCHMAGLRVPEDTSLVTTYGDPFISYIRPTVARYKHNPTVFARKLHRMILQIAKGGNQPANTIVVPDFVKGKSLGRAPELPARGSRESS